MRGFAILLLMLLAAPAGAEVVPRPGPGDPRLQSVDYDPDQVVALNVALGFAVTVELSPDERVETVSVGNSGAWQVQVNKRADHLFIKPLANAVATNLTVVTDARRYNFALYVGAGDAQVPYLVRFNYPVPVDTPDTVVEANPTRYRLRGDKALWPSAMSDDHGATAIAWPPDVDLPAIYYVTPEGKEALINGVVKDGAYVIEGVYQQLVFRRGKAKATATRLSDAQAENMR
jgi:type IV secretion system protein VirB9